MNDGGIKQQDGREQGPKSPLIQKEQLIPAVTIIPGTRLPCCRACIQKEMQYIFKVSKASGRKPQTTAERFFLKATVCCPKYLPCLPLNPKHGLSLGVLLSQLWVLPSSPQNKFRNLPQDMKSIKSKLATLPTSKPGLG